MSNQFDHLNQGGNSAEANSHMIKDLLKQISIFANFNDSELAGLAQLGSVVVVKTGSHPVIEGENTQGLFVILQGKLSVYKNNAHGKMARIALLENGDWFGEYSLFDDAPRSATVICETSTTLFSLTASAFFNYLHQAGDNLKRRFYESCAKDLIKKFRLQNTDYIAAQQLLWKHALRRDGASAAASGDSDIDPMVSLTPEDLAANNNALSQESQPAFQIEPAEQQPMIQFDDAESIQQHLPKHKSFDQTNVTRNSNLDFNPQKLQDNVTRNSNLVFNPQGLQEIVDPLQNLQTVKLASGPSLDLLVDADDDQKAS